MTATYHHALPSGTRISSYEIRDVLGVGGFGITYKAHDHDLDRDVAIKEYLPTGLAVRIGDGTTVAPKSEGDTEDYQYGLKRFLEEARTLARFREPNIVRVITYLESHGTAYFVMDYEDGESLSERLKATVTLPEESIREIVMPMLRGLGVVHEQQFLHRDIKPQNIYLRRDGSPVLLDFGAARQALGEHSRAMTGLVTPGYAPFEQYLSGNKQGPWSDVYAMGATMYHCVTGFAPIAATERMAAIHDGEADPLLKVSSLLGKRYSAKFLEAMMWMLTPMPKDRPQSVAEALRALSAESGTGVSGKTKQRRQKKNSSLSKSRDTATIDLDAPSGSASQAAWQPETLKAVELNLEQHIGPMSRALIRKASSRTHSVEEMTQLLSRFIPTDRGKTEFLSRTRALSSGTMAKLKAAATPVQAKAAGAVAALNAELIQVAEQKLVSYVGPVAKVLVRKARESATDADTFYQLLARELSTEQARSAFLRDVGKT